MSQLPPRAVWVTAAFFALSGLVEIAATAAEAHPPAFWTLWDAFFRGALHFLLALGLWRRVAICRSVALVYCFAALLTYGAVLGMALAHAPVAFPASVRIQSLLQVPSCALLLPFLRSQRASVLFPKALFHS